MNSKQKFLVRSGNIGWVIFLVQLINFIKEALNASSGEAYAWQIFLLIINFMFDLYPVILLVSYIYYTRLHDEEKTINETFLSLMNSWYQSLWFILKKQSSIGFYPWKILYHLSIAVLMTKIICCLINWRFFSSDSIKKQFNSIASLPFIYFLHLLLGSERNFSNLLFAGIGIIQSTIPFGPLP